ncbi:hypothetical protein G9F32_11365 [Acinetobacter sp. 194]|uniref:hypothetical protein n=1 Tax=Acinetobacter shaoyimingii TaxID=2715164 RepID=UPI00140D5727|nr:hypothetical protein [Acinetobacter shaoyimingii]NHB58607.1 hypothetical protein [Acinetobacter shaoyimingii]
MKEYQLKTHIFKLNHVLKDKNSVLTRFGADKNLKYEIYIDNEQKFLCHNDHVQVIYEEHNQKILALLNQTQQLLYLAPVLNASQSKSMGYSIRRFSLICIICFVFCFAMVIASQMIRYSDIFLGDLYDVLPYISLSGGVIALFWFWTTEVKANEHLVQAIYQTLGWPNMKPETLICFQATNSYFELQDHLYDVSAILNVIERFGVEKADDILKSWCEEKDESNLCEAQRNQFKLVEQSGQLNALKLKQIADSEEHTDPFTELKAKVDDIPIYGYVDEFYTQDKSQVSVIRSSFRDHLGYYFWYMYDEKRYLYMDEDAVTVLLDVTPNWKANLYIWSFLIGMNVMFAVIWGVVDEGEFVDQFAFAFLHILAFYLFVGALGWVYLFFFNAEDKWTRQRNINQYVFHQLNNMIKLPNSMHVDALQSLRLKRRNKDLLSRTGFDLKLKLGRFEYK